MAVWHEGRGYGVHAEWAGQSTRERDLLVHSFEGSTLCFLCLSGWLGILPGQEVKYLPHFLYVMLWCQTASQDKCHGQVKHITNICECSGLKSQVAYSHIGQ